MRTLCAIAVCGLSLACGGFDNDPLTHGVVRGTLTETDRSATVAVLGTPAIAARPSEGGEFELTGVPQGEVELFAVSSSRGAVRVKVEVKGGAVVEAGTLRPRPAGWIELWVRAPSAQRLGLARVRVEGTPLEGIAVSDDGEALVTPLPTGCYDITVVAPGLGTLTRLTCVTEGLETHLELGLPDPDGGRGREGCSVTGCLLGYTCSAGGACEP